MEEEPLEEKEVFKKYQCEDLTTYELTQGKWFIGSALQAVAYPDLNKGCYYYHQPTIWTRMLQVDPINPYWEIHNETENFLLVDGSNKEATALLEDVLTEYFQKKSKKPLKLYSFGVGKRWLFAGKVVETELEIPFYIDKIRVGNYRKVFVQIEGRFYPLLDCTEFQYGQKNYFEINLNCSYLEMARRQLACIFYGERYLKYTEYFELTPAKLITDQRYLRLISLLETVAFLEKHAFKTTASYLGHTVKKIHKLLALQVFLLRLPSTTLHELLDGSALESVKQEIHKLETFELANLEKYAPEILADRYGITLEMQTALQGKKDYVRNYTQKTAKYFTDLPFCTDIQTEAEFITTLLKIQQQK